MDTKALRQKILDLAIRGKLVPQDPNDEPASVLLERIREQKQQMVKEGKLKKKDIKNDSVIFVGEDNLHYEKFANGSVKCIEAEIPFELPKGWAWTRISTVALFVGGYAYKSSKYVPDSRNILIRIGNIKNNSINPFVAKTCISDEYASETDSYLIRENDILFTMTGTRGKRDYFYSCRIEKSDLESLKLFLNQRVGCLRLVSTADILPSYFVNAIQSSCVLDAIFATETGNVNQGNIGSTATLNLLIPVAPTEEQYKIQEKSLSILSAIEQYDIETEDLLAIINMLRTKILDLAIRGQLVPQNPDDEPASVLLERIRAEKNELIKQGKLKPNKKESIIFKGEDNSYYEKMADGKLHCLDDQLSFELPEGWEWCNLSMIGTTNIGLTYRPTDITANGIMVLRSCNIVNDQIDLNDLVRVETTIRENQFAQENDILICARNGSRALVGKCALIPSLGEPASFGAFMAIYRTEYFSYIVHYLRSTFFRSVFNDGNSTTINQLTQDMLKRAIVPFPPLAEQHRIVAAIEAALYELNRIEKSLS